MAMWSPAAVEGSAVLLGGVAVAFLASAVFGGEASEILHIATRQP